MVTKPSGPNLPFPTPPFAGTTSRLIDNSVPARPSVPLPSPDAPNIVLILLDDVGFGTCGTFGGPVPTPALDRVAANGLRFNQFHTWVTSPKVQVRFLVMTASSQKKRPRS
ncbi:MAG: sulfatase-like hydrolase/transferase [Ilumatobacteraceae bacterium]